MKDGSTYSPFSQNALRALLFSVYIGLNFTGQAQDSTATRTSQERFRQFEFRHDNDFLLSTDKHYTTGSFITFRIRDKKDSLEQFNQQWNIALRHQFYTPRDIRSDNTSRYDRPYAGLLAASVEWTTARDMSLFGMELLMGVSGPSSGAQGFQDLFHSKGGIDTPPWTDQIANSFHTNLYFRFTQEWDLRTAPWAMKLAFTPSMAIGSLDIYIQPELNLYIGTRQNIRKSVAYGQLGPLNSELFGALKIGYRYVKYNAMLQGNAFGDQSLLTVPATEDLLLIGAEGCWRFYRNDIKIALKYKSSETPRATAHSVVTLSYARSF